MYPGGCTVTRILEQSGVLKRALQSQFQDILSRNRTTRVAESKKTQTPVRYFKKLNRKKRWFLTKFIRNTVMSYINQCLSGTQVNRLDPWLYIFIIMPKQHMHINIKLYIKTKLASVSLCCKSHRFKRANIKILGTNSTHRSTLSYCSSRPPVKNVKSSFCA